MRLECQTAQSKENKKASRHKIRKYKENGFGSSPAILRSGCFFSKDTILNHKGKMYIFSFFS